MEGKNQIESCGHGEDEGNSTILCSVQQTRVSHIEESHERSFPKLDNNYCYLYLGSCFKN